MSRSVETAPDTAAMADTMRRCAAAAVSHPRTLSCGLAKKACAVRLEFSFGQIACGGLVVLTQCSEQMRVGAEGLGNDPCTVDGFAFSAAPDLDQPENPRLSQQPIHPFAAAWRQGQCRNRHLGVDLHFGMGDEIQAGNCVRLSQKSDQPNSSKMCGQTGVDIVWQPHQHLSQRSDPIVQRLLWISDIP